MATGRVNASNRLEDQGIKGLGAIYYNLLEPALVEQALVRKEGTLGQGGALMVSTGSHTGRSPKDKYLVRDDRTRDSVWWSDQGENDNKPIDTETWNTLRGLVTEQLSGKRLFVVDTFCGANPESWLRRQGR